MKSPEALLIRIINHLAEALKNRLVLKGGMLLRLYQSPRSTQDVDFVLISNESKKKLRPALLKTLQKMDDVDVQRVEVNSRGIFIDVAEGAQLALIEINVLPSLHLPSEPLSTAALSEKYSLSGRIVSTMSIPEAFAHKIAATLERDALRDLYDVCQLEAIGSFDIPTLRQRLAHFSPERTKARAISFGDAATMLREKLQQVNQRRVEDELFPLLPTHHRTGVLNVMRASVGRVIQQLEAAEPELA